jgi:hypothetical protein
LYDQVLYDYVEDLVASDQLNWSTGTEHMDGSKIN